MSNALCAINFSHLIRFTVVLSALHHQPFILVQAWDQQRHNCPAVALGNLFRYFPHRLCFICRVVTDMTRVVCPKCGYSTLRKVSMTVNDDGTVQCYLSNRKPTKKRALQVTGELQIF